MPNRETQTRSLLLIRHAKAGSRSRWQGPDDLRPLSRSGCRQAEAFVDRLAEFPLHRLIASPSLRCVQTLEPLAIESGITIEPNIALLEGAGIRGALALVDQLASTGEAALCTHGDIVEAVMDELRERGVPLDGPAWAKKGSTWILRLEQGRIVGARYMPPPDI